MRFLVLSLKSFAALALGFQALSAQAYYGRSSTEAILTFESTVEMNAGLTPLEVDEAIKFQISHLMGTFQSVSFTEEFKNPGVLGEDFTTKILGQKEIGGRIQYRYRFKGKTVFKKTAFRAGATTKKIPIKLPLASDRIYSLGVVRGENLCTDHHYNSEGDFWYFWDPDMPGCPLKGNSTDVVRVNGTLEKLENTILTYPEYDRLYGKNGNKKDFEISVFLGYIGDEIRPRKDDAFAALKEFETYLAENKYVRSVKKDSFRLNPDATITQGLNFYRIYEKQVKVMGQTMNAKVKILLADTDVNTQDPTFHAFLVPSLEQSDIVVYDGHSGLGGNLHLDFLPPVKFKKSKYQVFFFNGCSSYPYFNGMFMKAKGKSGSLDILTAGLPTLSSTSSPNLQAFLDGFLKGKALSYQKILADLDRSNGEEGTYLFGVSGDEDNKFMPAAR